MRLQTNIFKQQIFCPDCGRTRRGAIISFGGKEKKNSSWSCKCQSSNAGLGFDWKIWTEIRDGMPLFFMRVISSGIQNQWIKDRIYCPVCGCMLSLLSKMDTFSDVKCSNCNILGIDIVQNISSNQYTITSSGVLNKMKDFGEKHFFPSVDKPNLRSENY